MSEKTTKKRRVEIIDIIKCLAIMAVVLGHTASNAELNGNPPLVYKIIYSFHMPLFFFLTGLSTSLKPLVSWPNWQVFLRKNILALIFPYLVWSLIYCNFNFQNVGYILYGSWQALGKTGTLTSLWYLTSLFMARIYVQCVIDILYRLKINEKRFIYLWPCIICLLIGVLLPKLESGYPLCLDNAFVGAAFILLGVTLKRNLLVYSVQKVKVFIVTLIISAGLYATIINLLGDNYVIYMMCKSSYGSLVPAFALAILGSVVFVTIAALLKRLADEWLVNFNTRLLVYIGQHTMGIFILHKPIMQQLIIPTLQNCLGTSCSEGIIRVLGASMAFTIALLLCRIIEHYVPEMLGIFRKDVVLGKEN